MDEQVDANLVIDNLALRLARVERENAILTAQLQQTRGTKEADDDQA